MPLGLQRVKYEWAVSRATDWLLKSHEWIYAAATVGNGAGAQGVSRGEWLARRQREDKSPVINAGPANLYLAGRTRD